MRRKTLISCLLLSYLAVSVSAHDLFLKFDTYFLRPNSSVTVRLFNGTFQKSDGAVTRDRMRDVSVIMPTGEVAHPPESASRDQAKMSLLDFETHEAGTYVVGISIKPREIDLKAAEFNDYLAHDGVPDILAARRKNGQLRRDVRERYSKHVEALFQVGDAQTDNYKTPLNYPVEIMPQQNPYELKAGETIEVLCTLAGQPLANQYVMAGWDGRGRRMRPLNTRTDANGIARFRLGRAGKWYVKMIHMTPLDEPKVNYESKWASLTFEIR